MMNKLFRGLLVVGLAWSGMAVGCNGDDDIDVDDASVAPSDSGNGSSSGSTSSSSGATDSGADTGNDAAPACDTCAQTLQNGPGNTCEDNGPPSSLDRLNALFACVCVTNGGACSTVCGATCQAFDQPTQECAGCFATECGAELDACINEDQPPPPSDAGTDASTDAGDASN